MANPVDPATPPAAAGTSTATADVAAKVTTTRVEQTDPPIDKMSSTGVFLLTLYFFLFGLVAVNVLVNVWPPPAQADNATRGGAGAPPAGSGGSAAVTTPAPAAGAGGSTTAVPAPGSVPAGPGSRTPPVAGGGSAASPGTPATAAATPPAQATGSVAMVGGIVRMDFAGRDELRLIIIALFAGGLGSLVSSALSFASYLGSRRLDRWWTVWYLVRPPVGMALALITYFLLRAGLLSPGANVDQVSPYGVAAIAGLMGMFIKEATDKLKDVAKALFTSEENEQRAQPLAGTKQTEVATAGGQVTASPAAPDTSKSTGTGTMTPDIITAQHQTDPGA
jgi:hypothetical protein